MKLAYACTNYNNSAFTLAAVESLLKGTGHDYEVVIVDNASAPAEVQKLKPLTTLGSHVRIIESPENLGYFRGLNVGIRALRASTAPPDWMVVGNNDLEFPPDFADRLQAAADDLKVHSVVSPDIVTLDGEHQNPHVITGISKKRELVYDLYFSNYYVGRLIHKFAKALPQLSKRGDEQQWRTAMPVYQGHGSCYLLGPRFFSQFEELWAPTFMMSEEFFLSKQLSDVGEQVWYDPRISVRHHWHGSLQQLPSRKRWNMARDAHRVYRKYVKVF